MRTIVDEIFGIVPLSSQFILIQGDRGLKQWKRSDFNCETLHGFDFCCFFLRMSQDVIGHIVNSFLNELLLQPYNKGFIAALINTRYLLIYL